MDAFKELKELLLKDRSIRRFDASQSIDIDTLRNLVDLTRYCASGRNLQPLRYHIVVKEAECQLVYPLLAWAGYLSDWDGPEQSERPVAYLVQCLDTDLTNNCLCDDGLQIQAITLGAAALGIGACIIKSFNAPKLQNVLSLPCNMQPRYVIAMGYPVEKVVIESMSSPESIEYYRTPDGVHHVPKRSLDELIIK
jgi:nitroreductase